MHRDQVRVWASSRLVVTRAKQQDKEMRARFGPAVNVLQPDPVVLPAILQAGNARQLAHLVHEARLLRCWWAAFHPARLHRRWQLRQLRPLCSLALLYRIAVERSRPALAAGLLTPLPRDIGVLRCSDLLCLSGLPNLMTDRCIMLRFQFGNFRSADALFQKRS